jgi:hypothetical protein
MAMTTDDLIRRARAGTPLDQARAKFYAVPARKKRRSGTSRLSNEERRDLVDGLERLFEGGYAHLPLKRARYGFDPVQRLRILRAQATDLNDIDFYFELTDIIARMRDAHTKYERKVLGKKESVALPFMIERYGPLSRPRFIATNFSDPFKYTYEPFVEGAHITHWNGMPIEVAVRRHSEREYGGRPDSAMALALSTMTLRPLFYMNLPDEDFVEIGYRVTNKKGQPHGPIQTVAVNWLLIDAFEDESAAGEEEGHSRGARRSPTLALHPVAAAIKRAKRVMFAHLGKAAPANSVRRSEKGELTKEYASKFPGGLLKAHELNGPGGPYGYLRIYSFDTPDPDGFVKEVIRLLGLLPDCGLIIDVRDNPGGHVWAAEQMLQLLTPKAIEPTRFQVLATPFTRALCGIGWLKEELAPWKDSLDAAVRNGELYSNGIPITPFADCNKIGQVYGGPVVLIADSTTYSSGDIFCAGFVDNELGKFVCAGLGTGAGGANVWRYEDFRKTLNTTHLRLPSLPDGANVSISFRRTTRIGKANGTPIEDVGVASALKPYDMTFRDLTCANRDLLACCVDLLRKEKRSRVQYAINSSGTKLTVKSEGIDGLDARFDGHSGNWRKVVAGKPTAIRVPAGTNHIELLAYNKGTLRQRRLIKPIA